MNKPSWLLEIPADDYHQATKLDQYITSHRLAVYRRDPLEYKQRRDGVIEDKDTTAFLIGRAVHVLILEGKERFDEEFLVGDGPINPKTGEAYGHLTKAFKDWAAAQEKPVIGTEDFATFDEMRKAVHAHPVAKGLLAAGLAEGTIRTKWDEKLAVQARLDWFNPETGDLVDLKTCQDLDRFNYDIRDYGYTFQLAFYKRCIDFASAGTYQTPINCWLVAVEKKQPYRVAVVRVSEPTIEDSASHHMGGENWRDDNDAMMAELYLSLRDNTWVTRYEKTIII